MRRLGPPRAAVWMTCLGVLVLAGLSAPAIADQTSGSLDPSFGHDGRVTTRFHHDSAAASRIAHRGARAYAVAIDPKGRTVAVGSANSRFAVARYTPKGRLDRTFSGNGKAMTIASAEGGPVLPSNAYAAAVDSRGRIVAAGWGESKAAWFRFAVVRYRRDGHLDGSFGHHGIVRTAFPGGTRTARAVAIDSQGRIVVAGYTRDDFALARYLPDGKLDPSFGVDGRVITSFTEGADQADAVGLDASGRIVAVGFSHKPSSSSPDDFLLARYLPNGSLDSSFGTGGKVISDLGGEDLASSLAIDHAGRLVVAGESRVSDDQQFVVARYLSGGALDGSFGDGGVVRTEFGGPNGATSVAIARHGRIVAAGHRGGSSRRFLLARYRADGRLDRSFSRNGKVTTSFGDGTKVHGAFGLAIGGRDRIVTSGYVGRRFALARYFGGGR